MTDIFKIKLDISDVKDFLNITQNITNDINLCQGYNLVSGKSLMGIMALDLSKPIELIIRDRENDDIVYQNFRQYLI